MRLKDDRCEQLDPVGDELPVIGLTHLAGLCIEAKAPGAIARGDVLSVYHGALAEQFVGQELLAATHADPSYWAREERGSSAEVDYLIDDGRRVVPIEVKAGPARRLRSLRLLLDQYPSAAPGIVVSGAKYADLPEQQLVFVPLYAAGSLGDLARR